SPGQFGRSALCPGVAKGFRGLTTAEETRAVSRRERDGLVEEEQLGPTAATHDRAPPLLVFAETDEPGLTRPAPVQQGSGRRLMNDPAVTGEHPSLRYRDDVAEGRYPVLQRHWSGSACRRNRARPGIDRQKPV